MKLTTRLRETLRTRHYSRRTESAYVHWVRRFVRFHDLRDPTEMGEAEVGAFLTALAVRQNVSASTQNQALCGPGCVSRERTQRTCPRAPALTEASDFRVLGV